MASIFESAASQFYVKLCSKRADELKVGEKIWEDGFMGGKAGWAEVTFVGVKENGSSCTIDGKPVQYFYVDTSVCSHGGGEESLFRVYQTAEEKVEKTKKALEYQASLTKIGKPMKAKKGKLVTA